MFVCYPFSENDDNVPYLHCLANYFFTLFIPFTCTASLLFSPSEATARASRLSCHSFHWYLNRFHMRSAKNLK